MKINHIHFETIDSTNTWAKRHAHFLPVDQINIISANTQTAGRGRYKRYWSSPPHVNIYATYAFFLNHYREDLGNLPQVLALSIHELLENLGFTPSLKWPNDVLLSNKKVAGILCETTLVHGHLFIAIGVGLNVNMPLSMLVEIDRPATSLILEDGKLRNIHELLEKLNIVFIKNLDIFLNKSFSPFLIKYRKIINLKKGDLMIFNDNKNKWQGVFEKINENGSLVMKLENGLEKSFMAGEIEI